MVEGRDASTLLLRWDWGSSEPQSQKDQLLNTNPLASQILRILSGHRGVDRRISRSALLEELCQRMGQVSDREMRVAIEKLRRGHAHGAWICADLRGGYFIARDAAEIDVHLSSDERRAQRLLERVRLQRHTISLQESAQMDLLSDDE